MNKAIYELGLAEGSQAVKAGRLTAQEWMASCAERIEKQEPLLRAWVDFNPELAFAKAKELDWRIAANEDVGPIAGAPIGVKDIINTTDLPTQMGSPIWRGFTPGNNARVVDRIIWNGGIIAGKTVTAEFAVHHPGETVNPFNHEHTPGTSSSGSAVAVASGMVPAALGTQTLGSLIRPASYCGIYAFKPTFGTIPRTGILKTTDSLDQVGFFTRKVEDLRLLFDVLRVDGPNYPFSANMRASDTDSSPFKAAFVRTGAWSHAADYARHEIENFLGKLGQVNSVQVEEEQVPVSYEEARLVHQAIYSKCLSHYFEDEYRSHPDLVSQSMKDMIGQGLLQTGDDYARNMSRQAEMRQMLDDFFEDSGSDVIITLSAAGEAPRGLEAPNDPDTLLVWTLCGAPVINIPAFTGPNGLPFGAQIIGRRYHDYRLLRFAEHLAANGLAPSGPNPQVAA